MPSATAPAPPAFYVPTVDIGPFLDDPTSKESEAIIEDVRAACLSTGFFVITNHGIPISLQDSIFDAAAEFFKLPLDEKKKLDAKTSIGHRGYDVLASQSYEEDVLPDLKEVEPIVPDFFNVSIVTQSSGLLRWPGYPLHRCSRASAPLLHGKQRLAPSVDPRT